MAFPGSPGGMPAGMDPNAGMNEQERQMVKYVRRSGLLTSPRARH